MSYKGKNLSEWITQLQDKDLDTSLAAAMVLRECGSDAIPFLLKDLDNEEGVFGAETALRIMARSKFGSQAVILAFSSELKKRHCKHRAELVTIAGSAMVAFDAYKAAGLNQEPSVLTDDIETYGRDILHTAQNDADPAVHSAAVAALDSLETRHAASHP